MVFEQVRTRGGGPLRGDTGRNVDLVTKLETCYRRSAFGLLMLGRPHAGYHTTQGCL